ncbi:MAG TPA: arsinothricin resistance N-acetyltransferase ArsN1 family A [Massilibacterium sp.]|nr:arsinothricin resistance N-acetyltransferase ArsN1 family A [Massilibacterium sp.]
MSNIIIRPATLFDLEHIRRIYNQGIEEEAPNVEMKLKTTEEMKQWFDSHDERFQVFVMIVDNRIIGWAAINQYSVRDAYQGIGEISIYFDRFARGKGYGVKLLNAVENHAREHDFHKLVLFMLTKNKHGQKLYEKLGFHPVGIFKKQGLVHGEYVDIMAMEKLLIEEEND